MDIITRVPLEIAFQILIKLDIQDVTSCQLVSRQWYWITVDQSIWKNIFLEHERPYGIPSSDLSPMIMVPTVTTAPSMDMGEDEERDEETPSSTAATTVTTMVATERDWKQECKTRVLSDRNWSNGHIQSVLTLSVHHGGIVRLRIKAGKLLSGDMFGQVAVWDTTTYQCLDLIDCASVGPIQLLDFSPKKMIMTAISRSGVCRIWDLQTKTLIHSSSATDVTCMTMDDAYLVLGKRNCEIHIVDFTTGQLLRRAAPLGEETLQDIYIQNNTLVVATGNAVRIISIETLEILLTCTLPISDSLHSYCSVFHIRSLILLTDLHLLHVEWEPLRKSPNERFGIDNQLELPPNLLKAPSIHRTKVPPISTITSIAIGGKHPHVLTTNADRPSLNETIRVCPTTASRRRNQDLADLEHQQPSGGPDAADPEPTTTLNQPQQEISEVEDNGIVLSSRVAEVALYLETCGLKPSFMDVDEDVIVIGTSKGDIVVLNMLPLD